MWGTWVANKCSNTRTKIKSISRKILGTRIEKLKGEINQLFTVKDTWLYIQMSWQLDT